MKICLMCKKKCGRELFKKDRRASDGLSTECKECTKLRNREYYQRKKGQVLKTNARWKKANKDKMRLKEKEWRQKNKKKIKERMRKYYQMNSYRYREVSSRRRSTERKATPPWLTEEHLKEMRYVYWLRKDLEVCTGQEYHVDHIEPILGKDICGLHVPWNLQILPKDLNLSKGNRREYGS